MIYFNKIQLHLNAITRSGRFEINNSTLIHNIVFNPSHHWASDDLGLITIGGACVD